MVSQVAKTKNHSETIKKKSYNFIRCNSSLEKLKIKCRSNKFLIKGRTTIVIAQTFIPNSDKIYVSDGEKLLVKEKT